MHQQSNSTKLTVSVAICTGMGEDLTLLLESLVCSDCNEILIIGTEGGCFPENEYFKDPRVKIFFAPYLLSYKRKKALQSTSSDILAFIDADALASPQWVSLIREIFADPQIGIVTGPSLLPDNASLWKRTAQLVMASSQYSKRRYYPAQPGYVKSYDIIGANMSFRRTALEDTNFSPEVFPSYGEDMFMSHKMEENGWKIFYHPEIYVIHEPHDFVRQVRQIYSWGSSEIRLRRAGFGYPKRDPAYFFYIPTLILFSLAYMCGEWKELLRMAFKSIGRKNK